jgi:hypothetical protein
LKDDDHAAAIDFFLVVVGTRQLRQVRSFKLMSADDLD